VAEIKHVIAVRQHGMRDVLMHQPKARAIVKVFTGGVRVGVEIMHEPGRRKDPVLETFVVVTILRIGLEHAIVDTAREAGPTRRLRRLVIKRIGRDAQTGDRYERMVLAVSEGLARLW